MVTRGRALRLSGRRSPLWYRAARRKRRTELSSTRERGEEISLEHAPHAPCRGARRAVQAPRMVRHVPFPRPRGRARGLPRERMHEQLEPRRHRAAGTPQAHTSCSPKHHPHIHTPTHPPTRPHLAHTPTPTGLTRTAHTRAALLRGAPPTPPLCRSSRTGAPSPVASPPSPYSLPSAFLCSALTTRAAALPPGRAG